MGTNHFTGFANRDMKKGELISLRTHGRPCRVACVGGRVWVTASGLAADTILSAGQEAVYGGRRRIVVEALEESTVRFEPKLPARPRQPVLAPQPAR